MEGEQSQTYQSLNRETINEENVYEVSQEAATEEGRVEQPKVVKQRKDKEVTWNKPIILLTVLLSLIVMLLIVIFGLLVTHMSDKDTTAACTTGRATTARATAVGGNGDPNLTEWAISIVHNYIKLDKQISQTTRDSAKKLINIVNTLSNLQDTSTSTAGVADDILLIAQELLVLHNDSTALPTSCKELKSRSPDSPSGHYVLASANGSTTYTAYCNMGTLCGSGGGWTRLAYLDMSDATQNCPSGFRLYQSGGVRACGRTNGGAGCISVQFPSNGISYSQICGRVTGYQYARPDALHNNNGINSPYVDGVSITRGSPRQHVWSLITGKSESTNSRSCPCNNGSSVSVPPSIGNNYFCESGFSASYPFNILYTSDPLWDGQGCGSLESPCCNAPGIPWFHRDYGSTTTTDYIELRVCANYNDEDSPVSYYEIYVK
uniref:Fibrinogen C-terminal domain-containing protein n=1 Tax=Amphimedon queenslandica TaxID=400682 RepID=A0A1X7UUM5_AMPQE